MEDKTTRTGTNKSNLVVPIAIVIVGALIAGAIYFVSSGGDSVVQDREDIRTL